MERKTSEESPLFLTVTLFQKFPKEFAINRYLHIFHHVHVVYSQQCWSPESSVYQTESRHSTLVIEEFMFFVQVLWDG